MLFREHHVLPAGPWGEQRVSGFVSAHLLWSQRGELLSTAEGQAGKPRTPGLRMDLCRAAVRHTCYRRRSSTAKGEWRRKTEEVPICVPDALQDHLKYIYLLLCPFWKLF